MLALARLYLTVDDLDSCQQQCVQLLKMDSENDAATVVSIFSDVRQLCLYFSGSVCWRMAVRSIQELFRDHRLLSLSTSSVIQNETYMSCQDKSSARLFSLNFARSFTFTVHVHVHIHVLVQVLGRTKTLLQNIYTYSWFFGAHGWHFGRAIVRILASYSGVKTKRV